jgi:electron transport complex protein RnfG
MVRHMLVSSLLLAAFTVAATGLVVVTHDATAERIERAEKAVLLQRLHTLVPPERHDNNLFADRIDVRDPALLGTGAPVTVYRARRGEEPVAAILTPVAPDGYSGDIRLLVAVNADGSLAGVRVIGHRETPGLGDKIEATRSDWITRFTGRSLADPEPARWRVRKDGGAFDQFAGATITPRAVVKAVYNTLRFVEKNRDTIFVESEGKAEEEHHE